MTPLTTEHCDVAARRLDEAISRLRAWGVRIHESSRLPAAVRLLRQVAKTDRFPRDQLQLTRIGNALTTAVDFDHISRALPPTPVAPIREDLQRAVAGTLDDFSSTDALRSQSQLLIGTVLAAAGYHPGAPDTTQPRPSPDYVVSVDGLPCGVEIGRPTSVRGIESKADEAVKQVAGMGLRHHVMVFDLSDVITALIVASPPGAPVDPEAEFQALNRQLSDRIAADSESRVILYVSIVRLFIWRVSRGIATPVPLFKIYGAVFKKGAVGLVQDQANRLRTRVLAGWEALGGVITDLKPVP